MEHPRRRAVDFHFIAGQQRSELPNRLLKSAPE
jgi:hypothetical protein